MKKFTAIRLSDVPASVMKPRQIGEWFEFPVRLSDVQASLNDTDWIDSLKPGEAASLDRLCAFMLKHGIDIIFRDKVLEGD